VKALREIDVERAQQLDRGVVLNDLGPVAAIVSISD
jgi:hypothetical protein